jgi:hypothetical protein
VLAILLEDMTFYGPDQVLQDFAGRISAIRSMARDVQYSTDRAATLALHMAPPKLAAGAPASLDYMAIRHRMDMATMLTWVKNQKGDDAMNEAITRIAALPDVRRGE